MEIEFSEEKYEEMLAKLFLRFPSFQKDGASAYKPGIANMEFIDQLMGHPHRNYRIIHVAGTNGKGSVSNMLASVLAACGCKVGLYTSPHITDFRERMRVISCPELSCTHSELSCCHTDRSEGSPFSYISKQYVWDFLHQWQDTFDHLDLSFFEITTIMALQWFADENVDLVVLETGLGGRLDSTNIVSPILSVITNIGLDHCDMLGESLAEIAFEKAGIIKPRIPVVVGESHPETDPVFERKVLYTNLPEPCFMGNRPAIMSLLTYADKVDPVLWTEHETILQSMDLQGEYQRKNLRTVLAAIDVLGNICDALNGKTSQIPLKKLASASLACENCRRCICDAIIHTASRTGFRGRWEKLSDNPYTICDIGHNEHGLRHNFAQLAKMKDAGSKLIIVYGSVADKDVDSVLHLMPEDAVYIFTQAQSKRALAAETICDKYLQYRPDAADNNVFVKDRVADAVAAAREIAAEMMAQDQSVKPVIYIGGSTYVVSEAVQLY